jgi:hypothetical protein
MLACALAAQGSAAEPGKPAKPATPARPSANLASLTFARSEDQGMMNRIPSYILFEPRSGFVEGRVTRAGSRPKAAAADPRHLVLAGGDRAAFTVRPGTYSVHAQTPVKDQPPTGYAGHRERVWTSPEVKIVLSSGDAICVVVEPGITGAEYDGSWVITKAAPADCGAAP